MNFKTLVLGSAAAVMTVAGAQAADLPAEPVDYVRVCDAYGSGYYYLPGTETCLRVGGRVRVDYRIADIEGDGDDYGLDFRSRAYVRLDARTETDFGTLRTALSVWLQAQDGVQSTNLEFGFVQWAGFTFGRTFSFFDTFWGGGYDFGSNVGIPDSFNEVNVAAYTFDVGNGVSATIALQDDGNASTTTTDEDIPNIVAKVTVNQAWGGVDFGVVANHLGNIPSANGTVNAAGIAQAGTAAQDRDEWGFALNAGLEVNVPVAGANDRFGLYALYTNDTGSEFAVADDFLGAGNVEEGAHESYYIVAGFTHFFSSDVSFAVTGAYSDIDNDTLEDFQTYAVAGTLAWTPVSGLVIGAEAIYTSNEFDGPSADVDAWEGLFRVQRSF